MGPLRLLLDTHTVYWWHRGDPALSASAQAAIADSQNEKYVSAITAWEFITKFRSGKQPEFAGIVTDVAAVVASHGFIPMPIAMRHARVASNWPCGRGRTEAEAGRGFSPQSRGVAFPCPSPQTATSFAIRALNRRGGSSPLA